ncbi:MAG TPA: MarR family transcriptional regulator [Mycobacteriales bacterium]|nr:MarR family transcriptional regulator [Mycobacteriales bacterium]
MASSRTTAQTLLDLFAGLQARAGGDLVARLDGAQLSMTQYKALGVLAGSRAGLSVKELADRLSLSGPATSRATDHLVRLRYVERTEDDRDRRSKRLEATTDGRTLAAELDAVRLAGWRAVLDELTPAERTALHDAAQPMLTRLAAR